PALLYSGPITINEATTIKAITVADGMRASDIATYSYTVPAATVTALVYNPNVTVTTDTYQLSLSAVYSDASILDLTNTELVWSSSDPGIADVSSKGVVTAKQNGVVTISATFGELTASFEVTVSLPINANIARFVTGTTITAFNPVDLHLTDGSYYPMLDNDEYRFLFIQIDREIEALDDLKVAGLGDYLVLEHQPYMNIRFITIQTT